MAIAPSKVPLQKLIKWLPKPMRRIKVAQFFASIIGTPYHLVAFPGGNLVGNVRDAYVANSLIKGAYEDNGYFELARCILQNGETHVDLGANYGFHTFGLSNHQNSASVKFVLIDANPDCIACIEASAAMNPKMHCTIFHKAATSTNGSLVFTHSPSSTGQGHVYTGRDPDSVQTTVASVRLDDLFASHEISRVGLMKIDIEGSETGAVRGMSRLLETHAINFVYFEVNPECLALQHTSAIELFDEFERHGYELFWHHTGLERILKTYGSGNLDTHDFKKVTITGAEPYNLIKFDRQHYHPDRFGQCDLIAVSPLVSKQTTRV